ncbi:efflux transporter outer membrane subunit [Novosphingobium malaysiense]|uniref:RND transporter n=1 Tax=Novosphingobium malaysiense TaxID=1348853 RepID=A0A0B1ZVG7_9SPHN|nr:efflux transporter outer membrane subunit [Novosphingobium malaysiense]KHK93112.1 RND transporter [Novosphingobium malaysiense]
MSTRNRPRVAAVMLASALSLSACAAPDLGPRPKMTAPGALASAQSLHDHGAARTWPADNWWTVYGDPQLDALVGEALAGSPSVALAQARIRQARGAAQVAGAATLPSVGAEASGGLTKQSYNMGIPSAFVPHGWKSTGTLALSGDFNLDLWGKNRKALAAATSEAEAAMADARQAELMLSSNVVSSYFDLARLIERGKALGEASEARAAMVDLFAKRVQHGLENNTPLRRAQAAAASARAAVSANEEQIALRRHAIAALLGAGPDRGLAINPPAPASVPGTGIPAEAGIALAGRRPDIVAARLRAEAAAARIDVARAQFMPDISLRGLIGMTSLGISNLVDSGSTYGNAGAALTLPIFQGGRLKGNFTQARGAYDAAVADYNATVAGALQDVADALASQEAAAVQEQEAVEAASTSGAAFDLAMKRYRAGLSSYLEALDAQTAALQAREAEVDAHFRTLASEVALKRALGGGFADNSNEKAPDNE